VVGVHAFCLAGSGIDVPGRFLSWDASWDCEGWFCLEGCHNRYESALGLAGFSVFPVSKELDAC